MSEKHPKDGETADESYDKPDFWIEIFVLLTAQTALAFTVWYISDINQFWALAYPAGALIFWVLTYSLSSKSEPSNRHSIARMLILTWGLTIPIVTIESAAALIWPTHNRSGWSGREDGWIALILTLIIVGGTLIATVIYKLDTSGRSVLLDIFCRRILGWSLSPGFGYIQGQLSETDIRNAFPSTYPSTEFRDFQLSGSTEGLSLGAAWAEGLRTVNSRSIPRRGAPKPYVTTIGFVRFRKGGIKLAVVNYFRPRHLFRAWITVPSKISVANELFPVVTRPWLPTYHDGNPEADGHCWVTFGNGSTQHGIVTAQHISCVQNSKPGDDVHLHSSRSEVTGTLRMTSKVMDTVLIEVKEEATPKLMAAPYTKVIGFKPVRLRTGRRHTKGPLEGIITGLPGFDNGIYFRRPGGEPLAPAVMTFSTYANRGDSGCLVIDIEGKELGHTAPYIIYQGVLNLGRGKEGYGVYLGQVAEQWSIQTQFDIPRVETSKQA